MAKLIDRHKPDLLVCLGDRFEMFAAASASVPFNIPLIHLHGGEVTYGAFDDKFRHALTKLSDVHFTSCEKYKERVISMGVHPSRVFNVGALSLDNIKDTSLLSLEELGLDTGLNFKEPVALVTYHPVTNELEESENQVMALIEALNEFPSWQFLITGINADPSNDTIANILLDFVSKNPRAVFF